MNGFVLVVEDDSDINNLLSKILRGEGYRIVQAFSGTEGRMVLEREEPDLILLDLMLPGITGETLLKYIREERKKTVPVLVISAKDSLRDKVSLLKNGADDYITKPFEPEEVAARVLAALRRGKKDRAGCFPENILEYRELTLYPEQRKVTLGEKEIALTAHEFDILHLLMQKPEKVYSRELLYELVWQGGYYGENNTVNVHVSNIRKKLKKAAALNGRDGDYIQTVYNVGFKMKQISVRL